MAAADRQVTCRNNDGFEMTFTERALDPFLLVSADGIYDRTNNINITQNVMTDGGIYQGSVAKYRDIVLTLKDTSNFDENRDLIDRLFKKDSIGTLTFTEKGHTRAIEYVVEKVKTTGTHTVRYTTISLICPDPFFYDPFDIVVFLSQLMDDFEFIHEFSAEGEDFGHYLGNYENIYNESANENIGLSILLKGDADIVNPVITRLEYNDFIQIGDENNPFTLETGDSLLITTGTGNKHVYWMHDGQTEEINYRMIDGSSFIQLKRGNNYIAFDSDAGKNTMTLTITYRMQYARA